MYVLLPQNDEIKRILGKSKDKGYFQKLYNNRLYAFLIIITSWISFNVIHLTHEPFPFEWAFFMLLPLYLIFILDVSDIDFWNFITIGLSSISTYLGKSRQRIYWALLFLTLPLTNFFFFGDPDSLFFLWYFRRVSTASIVLLIIAIWGEYIYQVEYTYKKQIANVMVIYLPLTYIALYPYFIPFQWILNYFNIKIIFIIELIGSLYLYVFFILIPFNHSVIKDKKEKTTELENEIEKIQTQLDEAINLKYLTRMTTLNILIQEKNREKDEITELNPYPHQKVLTLVMLILSAILGSLIDGVIQGRLFH